MRKSWGRKLRDVPAICWSARAVSTVAMLLMIPTAACRQEQPPIDVPIEEVEITPPPDALVDPEADEKAVRYESLSGQLPSDFPALPLPSKTTVIDQEVTGATARIHLLVPERHEDFAVSFPRLLAVAGWNGPSTLGASGAVFRHGDETVTVTAAEEGPSTSLVIEY